MSDQPKPENIENETPPSGELSDEELGKVAGGIGLVAPDLPPTADVTLNKQKTAQKAHDQMTAYIKG